MKKNLPLIISSLLVLVLVVMALFAPWLAPHDPYTTDIANKLQGFSMQDVISCGKMPLKICVRKITVSFTPLARAKRTCGFFISSLMLDRMSLI